MIEKPTPRFGLMPFSWSIRLTRPAINQTTKIVIAICKSYEHDVSPDAHRPGQDYYPSTSTSNDTILLPLSNSEQMTLVLKQTAGIYGIGGGNDYTVFDGDRAIGQYFMSPASPPDRNWMWTITAREQPRSIHSRGYSETREQAMTDFKTQGLSADRTHFGNLG
jgi:hypothetical protein